MTSITCFINNDENVNDEVHFSQVPLAPPANIIVRKWSITLSYIRIIHRSEQSGVADRRDADDRLRAVSNAPLSTITKEIRRVRSFFSNDCL